MTPNEKKLAAHLLDMAAETFSNHGCNDFDLRERGLSIPEMRKLVTEYHALNGDLEEADKVKDDELHYRLEDFCAMRLMAAKLRGEV